MIAAAVMVRPLNCIVAVSQNMGIGKNGDLPWPLLRYWPDWVRETEAVRGIGSCVHLAGTRGPTYLGTVASG